ncbi:hypothetical protein C8A05DRAFT_38463 [Staphylotrichum tortipilum]|uniref:E3 ubiquitin-protein ligase listerin n=1 Tax=Staphylotrichum tortipilum TaxID=2831512 RepID=A0AAN6RNU7_9PEZI|nr:hypothetical protein C8A05DRAFT_38463 [Staphylotrichum longicolle]
MFPGKSKAAPSGFGGFTTSSTTLSYLMPPPDFSAIPQDVVVPFKNLLKKASTTKEKALQDVLSHVRSLATDGKTLDESIIDVYVELYPRLSIDGSARVRELAHQLLFHLLSAAKKRMAKQLPSFVGPWLAGTFDRDKRTARAASDALASFLQTKEKEENFWKGVQTRALEFATEAIKETPDTLSDERSTTKQDSDAKYYRVVGASLSLALNLIKKGDLATLQSGLASYLQVDALWTLSKAEDGFVQRAFYQFLGTLLETNPEILEPRLQQVGKSLVADSMKKSQVGAATDLLRVLAALTRRFPQVWGTQRHPLQRLQQFVSQGSQGGGEEYWRALDRLLDVVPEKAPAPEVVSVFLGSIRKGIAERLESHTGRLQAFHSYAHVFKLFLSHSPLSAGFLEENLSGLTRQYLHPAPDSSVPAPQRPDPLAEAWFSVAKHSDDETRAAVTQEWQKLENAFLAHMANSLPEVSEGYSKSQAAIASEGECWFSFAANVLSRDEAALSTVITSCSAGVLRGALDLLAKRNFKPFGAASVIQSAFRHCPRICSDNDVPTSLFPAKATDIYSVIVASPSLPYLVSDLTAISRATDGRLGDIWTSLVDAALRLSDHSNTISAIRVLVGIPSVAEYAHELAALQDFLVATWKEFAHGESSAALQDICEATLSYDTLTEASLGALTADIISGLEISETSRTAVSALELLLRKRPDVVSGDHDLHVRLITSLLALTELPDPALSGKARGLRLLLDERPTEQNPMARILENHLSEAGPSSLEVDTLVQQALATLKSGSTPAEDLFPSSTVWMEKLESFLSRPPNPSLSLTSSLGGAYFLVQGKTNAQLPPPVRDSCGRSTPARMALFTAKLLASGVQLASLPPEFQLELMYLLCLTEALAGDQIAAAQTDGLWSNGPETGADVQEFCDLSSAAVRTIIGECGCWTDWTMFGDSLVERLINFMVNEAVGLTPAALYTAKSLSSLLQLLDQTHGGAPTRLEEWLTKLGIMRATPNSILATAAFLTGFGESLAGSKGVATLCARLISEMPGFPNVSPATPRALPFVVLLNLCLDVYEAGTVPVETRKQVLALQQFTRWANAPEELGHQAAAETCRAITRVIPGTESTYGPYWENAIEFCIWLWNKAASDAPDQRLPYVYSSLKLMQALRAVEDPNDDLAEALADHQVAESAALIELLSIPREATASLPSHLVDALLARAVKRIPDVKLEDLEDIYEAVASESREIQNAAFGLLHRALPAAQEDINLAVVMDKKAANLPDELLSLLLNAPNPDDFTDEDLAQFPVCIRSYLLAWHLVFDAYSKASFRVRSDYTENLRAGKQLDPLLRFLVDVLGHALARALDLDKEGFTAEHIRSYSIDLADSEPAERGMNWLLIHLFYLILKYIPGLFKMWYLDCPSKQTKNTVQSWMQRFFSPLIISDALDEVVEWSLQQEKGDGETEEVIVKVSKNSREITAGYPVDDDAATISLHVPTSYPLDPVDVVSVKRVAVKEDKWQSWLKATKAVIMFGNCSLVDGLTAFRRNISLALKDQEECAICYSIIAQDKTLPDKKCGTCNHFFHRVCLYKWFQNSGRNTCPLCRNAIDYLGSDTKRRRPEHE